MSKILILGAHGATAQIVIDRLLAETQADLVLYLRHAARLNRYQTNPRVTLIEGDAQDVAALTAAMADVDVVYSNLGGVQLATFTQAIITAMAATGRTRLIFYSALGALHEVPGKFGQWNEQAPRLTCQGSGNRPNCSPRILRSTRPSCGRPGSPTKMKSIMNSPAPASRSKAPKSRGKASPTSL